MKDILGLRLYNGYVFDRWMFTVVRQLDLVETGIMEGKDVESEVTAAEKRLEVFSANTNQTEAYALALEEIRNSRPDIFNYLSRVRSMISAVNLRRIRLALWYGMGKEIPFNNDLDAEKVIALVYSYDFQYFQGRGWFLGEKFVGKNKFQVLEWSDDHIKPINRLELV